MTHDIQLYGQAALKAMKEYTDYGLLTPNEMRAKINLPPFGDDRITNCKNCAAPLNAKKYCEYCGTQY